MPKPVSRSVTKVGGCIQSRTGQYLTLVTDEEDSKEEQKKLEEKFAPLIEWLKEETKGVVRDGGYNCVTCH